MAEYHTAEEEAAIREETTLQLAKRNNRLFNGALIYESEEKKAKHEELYYIVRDELAVRGILETANDKRLIDGSELAA